MKKINYDKEMEKLIKNSKNMPALLLHSCCGPCSSAVIERLYPNFKLEILYYNPNIDTRDEYYYRASEQTNLIKKMNLDIDVRVIDYNPSEYFDYVRGFEHFKEGSSRCFKCYKLRLLKTARIAKENGFDFFSTTLSISPHKDSQKLNRMGGYISRQVGVDYLYSDFKKKNGYMRSVELSKKFDMYRQDYCGCVYSKEQMKL